MTSRARKPPAPLDTQKLEEMAVNYVGRYATSRARLASYLRRKLRERGWAEDGEPPVAAIVSRLADLRYVDDSAFADARAASLARRGYGERRVAAALYAAGIAEADAQAAKAAARGRAWEAALRFAERRRIGPFAQQKAADRATRQKAMAALLRAGHPLDIARRLAEAEPGEIPNVEIL